MKKPNLSQQTARRLYSLIAAEKEFAPGEKLPNELDRFGFFMVGQSS